MNDSGLLRSLRGVVVGISRENSVGFQCALELRALGAEVALTYRPARRDSCSALAERAGFALHLSLDANEEASIEQAFQGLASRWDRLDFLLHTLVHVPQGVLDRPLIELSREEFAAVLGPSVYSLIAVSRHALPLLERSPAPRIVTLTSPAGHRMSEHYHIAGIAKAALEGAVRYLAHELGPRGVLCNAVSFSLIETEAGQRALGAESAAKLRSYLARRMPTQRPLEIVHVAKAVAWLVSPLCENVTGEVITVDGGFSRLYL